MAEVALSWPGPGDFDDASMSFEAMSVNEIVGFDDPDANFHAHSGTIELIIYLRRQSDQTWNEVYRSATGGTVYMNTLTGIKFSAIKADGIRFLFTPAQGTAAHGWAGVSIRLNKATAAAGGGGGGGGSGTGNLIGAFAVGSTMLGAEPGGGGGGGGSGAGNLIGAFVVGQTMLGAEPGGGGGGDVPLQPGSPQPLEATLGGAASVVGAFATFIWEMAGKPAGVAALLSPYLSAPWPLAGTTANSTGITQYRSGWSFVSAPPAPGTRDQSVSYTITTTTSHGGTAYFYRKRDDTLVTTSSYSAGTNGSNFSWTFDAGEGNYVGRIEINSSGRVLQWETFPEPLAIVRGLLHSPIAMFADAVAEATVAADLNIHTLDAGDSKGVAEVAGHLGVAQNLQPTVVSGNASVGASLGVIVPMEAAATADSAVTGNLDQYISPGTANGDATVTGALTQSVLAGRVVGDAEVVAGLSTDASVQGGDSLGSAKVTGHATHFAQVAGLSEGATVRLLADLTREAQFSGGRSDGSASLVGDFEIHLLDARGGGGSAGDTTMAGHLAYEGGIVAMRAEPAGQTDVVGDFRLRTKLRAETSVGSATTSGEVIRVWFVAGAPAGDSTVVFDTLTVHTIPPSPIIAGAEVIGHATHDARYGGEIVCDSSVRPTYLAVELSPFDPVTVHAGSDANKGRLYVRPQDFDASTSDGVASVIGQILLITAALNARSQGGRVEQFNPETGLPYSPPRYDDNYVKGHLGVAFFFAGVSRGQGFAEFELALLLLNDSGLIRGNSRLDVRLDRLSTEYQGKSSGFATVPYAFLDRPSDMQAHVNDCYSGLGTWYPGGEKYVPIWGDWTTGSRPFDDEAQDPAHGEPGHHHLDGRDYTVERMNLSIKHVNTERRFKGKWDGTYEPFARHDIPNLPQHPWFTDPERGWPHVVPGPLPGPMRRRYQLADPGQVGGWFVDNSGPGFRDKAMRAAIVGEARFDEPQSTVDMDLELKSSMKGRITGEAVVTALALLLSYRTLLLTGNVTALRNLFATRTGGTTKSTQAQVPITQADAELLRPVHKTAALYT